MKNLSLFVSSLALCASTSYAAIDCSTLPTCESLGYKDIVANCPNQNKVLKCPFDIGKPDTEAKGTCLHEAAVGEIGYFPKPAGKGWLFCDGQTITKSDYPELYEFLKDSYCTTDHGGTCGTNTARLPDYRGYFLRSVVTDPRKTGNNYSKTYTNFGTTSAVNWDVRIPQKEGLPNITGTFFADDSMVGKQKDVATTGKSPTGAFKNITALDGYDIESSKKFTGYQINFSAQASNPIYGAQSGVTPPNMAVYVYIYAGR